VIQKNNKMKVISIIALLFTITMACRAQSKTQFRLEELLDLAKQNYPQIRHLQLVAKTRELSLHNAGKSYLPQVTLNGQASYQSDVTALPISLPGIEVPALSKDQYRLYAELNQPVLDGGMQKAHKNIISSTALADEQKVLVDLYAIREKIVQLFFSILISDQQLNQTEIFEKDLEVSLAKAETSFRNGVALKSSVSVLKAEILKLKQKESEIRAHRKNCAETIGLFIGQNLGAQSSFVKPTNPETFSSELRPEHQYFKNRAQVLIGQQELLRSRNRPRLGLFVQGGIGRPALNMLDNSFQPYYIAGIRFNWALTGLYTIRKEMSINELNRQSIDVQKELFDFNLTMQVKQHDSEIEKLRQVVAADDEIITIREEIRDMSQAQFDNGTLSSSDLVRELNALQQAQENKAIHELQLLHAQFRKVIAIGKI
jgi:outer membrane protein TolC